jgi:hypothetical protein
MGLLLARNLEKGITDNASNTKINTVYKIYFGSMLVQLPSVVRNKIPNTKKIKDEHKIERVAVEITFLVSVSVLQPRLMKGSVS